VSELDDLLDDLLDSADVQPGDSVDSVAWERIRETGLNRLGLPEELGGPGGGTRDAVTVVIRCAQAGLSVPIVEETLLATVLARTTERELPDAAITVALPTGAACAALDSDGLLQGHLPHVAWIRPGGHVLAVVPTAGHTYVADVPADALSLQQLITVADEPRASVTAEVKPGRVDIAPAELTGDIRLLASLGRSCQVLGALRAATALSVDHAGVRTQFGRPIGSQQAVQQLLVEAIGETAATESAIAAAIDALEADPSAANRSARLAVSAARVQAGRAAGIVARNAHQVHAAVGIATEHPLHHHTVHLWSWPFEYGNPRSAAEQFGAEVAGFRNPWSALVGN
jgi:acyl-CoA dehydrogenase